jgi:hypothetical protein
MFDNFHSYVYEPRKLEATEARLQRIYDAAKLGLKGDTLALAAGMRPTEYRQLTMLDPIAEYAEQKGKADGEMELSAILHQAAADGDSKAALEILKHAHGWTAAQSIKVEIDQKISITQALKEAETRVIEGVILNKTLERANDQGLLINNRNEDGDDYTDFNPKQTQKVA